MLMKLVEMKFQIPILIIKKKKWNAINFNISAVSGIKNSFLFDIQLLFASENKSFVLQGP